VNLTWAMRRSRYPPAKPVRLPVERIAKAEVTRETFLEDCKRIRELIRTGEGRPAFFPDV